MDLSHAFPCAHVFTQNRTFRQLLIGRKFQKLANQATWEEERQALSSSQQENARLLVRVNYARDSWEKYIQTRNNKWCRQRV